MSGAQAKAAVICGCVAVIAEVIHLPPSYLIGMTFTIICRLYAFAPAQR